MRSDAVVVRKVIRELFWSDGTVARAWERREGGGREGGGGRGE